MSAVIFGNGGREHAIAKHLLKSLVDTTCLFYVGNYKNYGMDEIAVLINEEDIVNLEPDFIIIGPEKYLQQGIADKYLELGVPVIGPTQAAARIETSKIFARKLISQIDQNFNPRYIICQQLTVFDTETFIAQPFDEYQPDTITVDGIYNFLEALPGYVIKPNGLCSGKGVKLSGDHLADVDETIQYINSLNGQPFLIEEKLSGKEFTLMSFTDSVTVKHMPIVKDYKRLNDHDQGPMTGGMGCVIDGDLGFLNESDIKLAQSINEKIVRKLNEIGTPFTGILYGSFMKTDQGEIKVIEYNARFGDPEAIAVLNLLQTPLYNICIAIANKDLHNIDIKWSDKAAIVVYLVPDGYPNSGNCNCHFDIDTFPDFTNAYVAGITSDYQLTGSRAIAFCETNASLRIAKRNLYSSLRNTNNSLFYRKDIGENIGILTQDFYQESGVNIDAGNQVVEKIKSISDQIGAFGGRYSDLIATCDGVGTKVKLAIELGDLSHLAEDLVHHCINDLLVQGCIRPLFFMDYIACHSVDPDFIAQLIHDFNNVCKKFGITLLGGETAEMNDTYTDGSIDIAGFLVGKMDNQSVKLNRESLVPGDIVYCLPSSGFHTNGYSLLRKILTVKEKQTHRDLLLTPHLCYLNDVFRVGEEQVNIKAMCHITGGGLVDNPPRVIPDDLKLNLDYDTIDQLMNRNSVYNILLQHGISKKEMYRVFNCGVGFMIIVDSESRLNQDWIKIGTIVKK